MDKAKIAEWVLSLVMEPAQAASVIGDLLETRASHHVVSFSWNVFQTLVATIWREAKDQPFQILKLATEGAVVQFAYTSLAVIAFLVVSVPLLLIVYQLHPPPEAVLVVLFDYAISILFQFLGSFYAGRWMARHSFDKEVVTCIAMLGISWVIGYGIVVGHIIFNLHRVHYFGWPWILVWLIGPLLGAIRVRRRRQMQPSIICY
jgi:hypothetical protein